MCRKDLAERGVLDDEDSAEKVLDEGAQRQELQHVMLLTPVLLFLLYWIMLQFFPFCLFCCMT